MRRKPKLKYTEMCMYIDENIRKPDADVETIYDYLVMISYMLAVKHRYFNREEHYDNFSHYFATIIYLRMVDARQYLSEDDPNYIAPIKSCLNYMKSVVYARKCEFCNEEFDFVTKEDDVMTSSIHEMDVINSINSDTHRRIEIEIDECFNDLDKNIKYKVYNGVYGKDKVLA